MSQNISSTDDLEEEEVIESVIKLNRYSLYSGDFGPSPKTNEILIDKLLKTLRENDTAIKSKLEAMEKIDITIHIITFKIYETTHEFKEKILQFKEERNHILISDINTSELSLILNDLDKKIHELEHELDEKIAKLKREKIDLQHQTEAMLFHLDEVFAKMKDNFDQLKGELDEKMETMYRAQAILIKEKYDPQVNQIEQNILNYEKLQMNGWKVDHSEEKLSEILDSHGLKFTLSGRLLTRDGNLMTFEEAQSKGYFKEFSVAVDKITQFFQEQNQQQQAFEQIPLPDITSFRTDSSTDSKISTQEIRYLKENVGKVLTLALAEITAQHPRDPIHYLGHYLFKYRYNQELEERQKKELEELTKQRRIVAQELWKKFIEEEAQNAVIDLILRVEHLIYEKELKRIEQEQMLGEAEEEDIMDEQMKQLIEEAKDKFE